MKKTILPIILLLSTPTAGHVEEYEIIGDTNSRLYLYPQCDGYQTILSSQAVRMFRDWSDARRSGFTLDKKCAATIEADAKRKDLGSAMNDLAQQLRKDGASLSAPEPPQVSYVEHLENVRKDRKEMWERDRRERRDEIFFYGSPYR